jgi:hypothetical protein
MSDEEYCERCRRLAPPWEDQSYVEWEAITRDNGEIGVICPGCVTGAEQQETDEDMVDVASVLSRCARCKRESPNFDTNPESPSYGDPESHGWYVVEDGMVCAACATVEERSRS